MAVSIEEIKRLRELTGVGMTDAKKALVEAEGDFDKALSEMRKKGLTKAEKKGEREAREGVVDSYVHSNRIGVLVEVNCETDFLARNEDFRAFVHDIAMHVAAASPEYVSSDEIPADVVEAKKQELLASDALAGKPADMAEKIVEGQLKKYFAERCLLDQQYVKNPDLTVADFVKENVAKLGENLVVRRFSRIALGEVA
ncbi:MAG: translation elongation factor Ts [Candidatus Saccharimonadales bacterium]